jgi:signal recognition particle subunit SRP54
MTPAERNDPSLLNASRRQRIAAGSGSDIQAVNALVKQFEEMRKMMKQVMRGGKLPDLSAMGGDGGGMGMPGGFGPGAGGGAGMPGLGAGAPGKYSGGGKRKKKRR